MLDTSISSPSCMADFDAQFFFHSLSLAYVRKQSRTFFHLSYNIFPFCYEFALEFFSSLDASDNRDVYFFPFRLNVALKLE